MQAVPSGQTYKDKNYFGKNARPVVFSAPAQYANVWVAGGPDMAGKELTAIVRGVNCYRVRSTLLSRWEYTTIT